MKYGICNVVIAPGRKEAADVSEMVTQMLFGETFEITKTEDNWTLVKTSLDNYSCWIDTKHINFINEGTYTASKGLISPRLNEISSQILDKDNNPTQIVMGSVLPKISNSEIVIGEDSYKVNCETNTDILLTAENIENVALKYLNTPYLWGGRSPFGIDCSGFTQLVYLLNGFILPRDAYQQADTGIKISTFLAQEKGDLAFFHNEKGKITHVGIVLDGQKIIHASGKVRIDDLMEEGILKDNKTTHLLSHITRVIVK